MTDANPYNATLIGRRDIHDALAVFKVRYDACGVPDFEPGQYTTLGLVDPDAPPPNPNSPRSRRKGPKLVRRAYTIASTPKLKSHIEFYVVRVGEGRFTHLLWDLKPGDPLFMDVRIKGTFTLESIPNDKHIIAVGDDAGLAPYLSMLNTYRGTGRWRKFVLLECCAKARDLAYADPLKKLADEDDSFTYLPTLTGEPADSPWQGLRGDVHAILAPDRFHQLTGLPLDPTQCHVLLCGSPRMIDRAAEDLQKLGFVTQNRDHPDGNIHFERYW